MKFVTFADEANWFCSGEDVKEFRIIINTVEKELIMIKKWFDITKLLVNKKTKQNKNLHLWCLVMPGLMVKAEFRWGHN